MRASELSNPLNIATNPMWPPPDAPQYTRAGFGGARIVLRGPAFSMALGRQFKERERERRRHSAGGAVLFPSNIVCSKRN